jgi:hypothetical protein
VEPVDRRREDGLLVVDRDDDVDRGRGGRRLRESDSVLHGGEPEGSA